MAAFALATKASAFSRSPLFSGRSDVMYIWPAMCAMASSADAGGARPADTAYRQTSAAKSARRRSRPFICECSGTLDLGDRVRGRRHYYSNACVSQFAALEATLEPPLRPRPLRQAPALGHRTGAIAGGHRPREQVALHFVAGVLA